MTSHAVWNAGTHAIHPGSQNKGNENMELWFSAAEARGNLRRSLMEGERAGFDSCYAAALNLNHCQAYLLITWREKRERIRLINDRSYMSETIRMITPLICNHVNVFLELYVCKLVKSI